MEEMKWRPVVIRMTAEFVHKVPEEDSADSIEFGLNESSWCSDNILDDLRRVSERSGFCLCDWSKFEYVREATEEDKRRDKWDERGKSDKNVLGFDTLEALYAEFWNKVNSWCDVQLAHPGCLPDAKALKRVCEEYAPDEDGGEE